MQHLLWNAKQRGNTAARFQLENKIIALKIALYFFILWRALFRLDNHPFLYSRYLPSPHPLSPIPLKFGRNGRRSLWQLYFQHQHRRWRQGFGGRGFNIFYEIFISFRGILVSAATFGPSLLQWPQEFATPGANSGVHRIGHKCFSFEGFKNGNFFWKNNPKPSYSPWGQRCGELGTKGTRSTQRDAIR